jgi:hypothetical protein
VRVCWRDLCTAFTVAFLLFWLAHVCFSHLFRFDQLFGWPGRMMIYVSATSKLVFCWKTLFTSKRHNSYWKLAHFYSILRTRPSSSPDQIKDSFLKLSKIYHPDNAETGDQAKFVRIKDAYDKIKDAPLRNSKLTGESEDLSHAAFVRRSKRRPDLWTSPTPHQHYTTRINEKLYH